MLEHVIATFRVRTGADFTQRLVIEQDLWFGHMPLQAQQFPIDGDFLAAVNLISRLRGLTVNADTPLLQHCVDLTPRTDALVGQIFLNSFHSGDYTG